MERRYSIRSFLVIQRGSGPRLRVHRQSFFVAAPTINSVDVLPVPSYKAMSAPVCATLTYHGAQAGSRQAKTSRNLIELSAIGDEDNKINKGSHSSDNDR